jgi:hypothetical protein
MKGDLVMFSVKEKSWSVRLASGYVLNGQVRSEYCGNCESKAKLIAGNNYDSNLILYGCDSKRCRHVLMRVDLGLADPETFSVIKAPEPLQMMHDVASAVQTA